MSTRVVVVTGASAGVGRATAVEFGRRGDRVALLARGRNGLDAAAREVEAAGGRALPIPTDVGDYEQVEAAAARAESELGPIDVWVNNAFSAVFAPFTKISMEEFRRTTEVTYLGYVHGTKAALRPDAPTRSWRAGARRLGPRLPCHPVAERVLRGQARDPGLPRVAAL